MLAEPVMSECLLCQRVHAVRNCGPSNLLALLTFFCFVFVLFLCPFFFLSPLDLVVKIMLLMPCFFLRIVTL